MYYSYCWVIGIAINLAYKNCVFGIEGGLLYWDHVFSDEVCFYRQQIVHVHGNRILNRFLRLQTSCWYFNAISITVQTRGVSARHSEWLFGRLKPYDTRSSRTEMLAILLSDWLRAGRLRGRGSSPGRVKNFHFSISSRPALGSAQPPIQWVPGALSRG
jgi:hypothetical protein